MCRKTLLAAFLTKEKKRGKDFPNMATCLILSAIGDGDKMIKAKPS